MAASNHYFPFALLERTHFLICYASDGNGNISKKQMVPEKWMVCDTANNLLIPSDNHYGFMVSVTIAVMKNIHEYFGRNRNITRILLQRDDRQYKLMEVSQTKFS